MQAATYKCEKYNLPNTRNNRIKKKSYTLIIACIETVTIYIQ